MSKPPVTTWFDRPLVADRRRVVLGSMAGGLLLGTRSSAAQDVSIALSSHVRSFFTADEWAFVLAACSRLIPSSPDGPGAIDALVPIFIDRQIGGDFGKAADWFMEGPHVPDGDARLGFQSPLTPAEIYRRSIASVDAWTRGQYDKVFARLDAADQDVVLRTLEAGKLGLPAELRDFFGLLLQNTKEGYFSDPQYGGNHKMAAWVHIGFPGARGSFKEWSAKDNVRYPLGPVSISGQRV